MNFYFSDEHFFINNIHQLTCLLDPAGVYVGVLLDGRRKTLRSKRFEPSENWIEVEGKSEVCSNRAFFYQFGTIGKRERQR